MSLKTRLLSRDPEFLSSLYNWCGQTVMTYTTRLPPSPPSDVRSLSSCITQMILNFTPLIWRPTLPSLDGSCGVWPSTCCKADIACLNGVCRSPCIRARARLLGSRLRPARWRHWVWPCRVYWFPIGGVLLLLVVIRTLHTPLPSPYTHVFSRTQRVVITHSNSSNRQFFLCPFNASALRVFDSPSTGHWEI